MPVTITAGITFSGGGLTMEFAPPSQATAGWFGGGRNPASPPAPRSSVQRITYATDTATASNRGPLSAARYALGGTGNLTYGWFGGGYSIPGGPSNIKYSTIDRITYTTDTVTASVKGPLNQSIVNICATGTSTDGWFGGGYTTGARSSVSRITYATDTATATAKGPLSRSSWNITAVTDSTTYGWFAGGQPGSGLISTIDRITYATDTATATPRGPLTSGTNNAGGTYTTSYGWIGGSPGSIVQRIDYANDTATASVRGPIYSNNRPAGSGDDTYGYFGGGYTDTPIFLTTVYRITYTTDTAAATSRGALFTASAALAATSGIQ